MFKGIQNKELFLLYFHSIEDTAIGINSYKEIMNRLELF